MGSWITVLFSFWQTLSLQKSPPLPGAKNFATWLCVEYANGKTAGAIDGSLQCIRRRLISASKQVE